LQAIGSQSVKFPVGTYKCSLEIVRIPALPIDLGKFTEVNKVYETPSGNEHTGEAIQP